MSNVCKNLNFSSRYPAGTENSRPIRAPASSQPVLLISPARIGKLYVSENPKTPRTGVWVKMKGTKLQMWPSYSVNQDEISDLVVSSDDELSLLVIEKEAFSVISAGWCLVSIH